MKSWIVAALTVLLLITGMPPAAAKGNGPAKVDMLTVQTGTVFAGDSAWVEILWEASGNDADDFQVVVKNPDPGWEIRYPENTGSYTSLYADATLTDGEIDFTAIHVTVPYAASGDAKLHLQVSWTTDGKPHQQSYLVKVPVAQYSGDDLTRVTTQADVPVPGGWVKVAFAGSAPRLDAFQMTVTPPEGVSVELPQGTYTSLARDARLERGETDFAAFHVEAPPGTYELQLAVSYTKDATPGSWTGTVTVKVSDS